MASIRRFDHVGIPDSLAERIDNGQKAEDHRGNGAQTNE